MPKTSFASRLAAAKAAQAAAPSTAAPAPQPAPKTSFASRLADARQAEAKAARLDAPSGSSEKVGMPSPNAEYMPSPNGAGVRPPPGVKSPVPASTPNTMTPPPAGPFKKGGRVKSKSTASYSSGGSVSKASSRADGIAMRGKTRGKMV